MLKKGFIYLVLFASLIVKSKAQDNVQWKKDSAQANESLGQRAWNDTRIISIPTTKIIDKHRLEFYIMHRFGNMGTASNGGGHTLYGFDVASDIYFGFDYSLLKKLQIGIGRSLQRELIDLSIKYCPLIQKEGGSPVSVAVYEDAGVSSLSDAMFYDAGDMSNHSIADRLMYLTQVIISTRLNKHISLELVPSLSFRNHVLVPINTNDSTFDENAIPAIGVGGRYMFNGMIGIVAEYYYYYSKYRTNNPMQSYYYPFSVGIEMHTGGHVFEINLSNASSLNGNNIIPFTTNTWTKGGYKLGFTISRLF